MPKNQLTHIEQFVIDKVKEIRISRKISQEGIASILDMTKGFIGQIESHKQPAKYNLNHINLLAAELELSPKDFLPDKPLLEAKTRKKKKK